MRHTQIATALLLVLFLNVCATSANAQNTPRVQFGGGAGWLMPSPEAVLIDSVFFPNVRVGPSQLLDTRTEFVTAAPDWFGDVVVYVAPRIGIMGQVAGMHANHPIFVQSKGIINHTRSRAYLGGVRLNLHCCNKGVPFVYGLLGRVDSRSHVDIGDPSINPPFEGPSTTSLGMAFGGGVETPGIVGVRVTGDLMTASRHVVGGSNWTARVNAGLCIAVR
jgi:hypothetical protein